MKYLGFIFLMLLIGCGQKKDRQPDRAPSTAAPDEPAETGQAPPAPSARAPGTKMISPLPAPDAIAWKTHSLADTGISFAAIDGVHVRVSETDAGTIATQNATDLTVMVRYGASARLDSMQEHWSRNKRFQVSKSEDVKVCGVTGKRLFATRQAIDLTNARFAESKPLTDGTTVEQAAASAPTMDNPRRVQQTGVPTDAPRKRAVPARTIAVLAFEHNGTPALISWTIRDDLRASYSAAEARFFESIRCE